MELEKPNYIKEIIGGLGILVVAGGIYFGVRNHDLNQTIKEKDKEIVQNSLDYKNKHNTFINEIHNPLVRRFNSKLAEYRVVLGEKEKLSREYAELNSQYDLKEGKYNSVLAKADSLRGALEVYLKTEKELRKFLEQNSIDINAFIKDISKLEETVKEKDNLLLMKSDTLNILQDFVNAYTISRRPLNQRSWDRVALPEGKRYFPENREAVRAIRAENKKYLMR